MALERTISIIKPDAVEKTSSARFIAALKKTACVLLRQK